VFLLPFYNNFAAAYWVLSSAELSYRIENKDGNRDSSEKDLDNIEEPMKSAILLRRRNLSNLELRGRLFELGCYEKNGVLHCTGRRLTLLKTIIHYANIYLTLRMFVRDNDEE
jgi:hypothetical protein